MSKYVPTIGIECHVQLKTKTKLFAAVGNDARNAEPNTLVSHICLGMPGALPYLNEAAVELAIRAAFALRTKPEKFSKFDRKHYFYPDLPKGYQISQFNYPIIASGQVDIMVDGEQKSIGITRAHLEEDAGKSTHPAGKDYSLVDLNRAGTPLLEIVSEPEIHTSAEAKAYARELYLLMKYAGVTDGDLYHGHMRFDVNVSLSSNSEKLGVRTETKNLNSFKAVERAVEYEIKRQSEILNKGGDIIQETRGWDEAKQKTTSQRGKEEAHDYRYFPDPDIPPIELDDQTIRDVEKQMPKMPDEYRIMLKELSLEHSVIEAAIEDKRIGLFIKEIKRQADVNHARRIALWIVNAKEKMEDWDDEDKPWAISVTNAVKLSQLVADNKLNSSAAKEIWLEIWKTNADPNKIAEAKNLLQVSDEGEIAKIVVKVIEENPKPAQDIKNGEMKAIGFLVGQVMKESKGKANPELAQKLIKEQLKV